MTIARENFIFQVGADFRRRLYFNGVSDLSGYTARLQVRSEAGASDLVLDLSTDADGGLTMGPNYVDIDVKADVEPDLGAVTREGWLSEASDDCEPPARAYGKIAVFDLKLYSGDAPAREYVPLAGELAFVAGVTRDA